MHPNEAIAFLQRERDFCRAREIDPRLTALIEIDDDLLEAHELYEATERTLDDESAAFLTDAYVEEYASQRRIALAVAKAHLLEIIAAGGWTTNGEPDGYEPAGWRECQEIGLDYHALVRESNGTTQRGGE